jgi:2'-5' RNA ligase
MFFHINLLLKAGSGSMPPALLPQIDIPSRRHEEGGQRSPVFLALHPTPEAAGRVSRLAWYLRDSHGLRSRPLEQRCFHVSLFGFGDLARLPREAFAAIHAAVESIGMPPFLVAFDRAMSFSGRKESPLVLLGGDGVAGLTMLQHELAAALRRTGFARRKPPKFTPHLTLLYDECRVREQAVEDISWTVRHIALVRSLYGQSRHLALARWQLRP